MVNSLNQGRVGHLDDREVLLQGLVLLLKAAELLLKAGETALEFGVVGLEAWVALFQLLKLLADVDSVSSKHILKTLVTFAETFDVLNETLIQVSET